MIKKLKSNKRELIKKEVSSWFNEELPGSDLKKIAKESTKYYYVVESYNDYKIVLQRPGTRKKGYDFSVAIENKNDDLLFKKNNKFKTPRFEDLVTILKKCKKDISKSKYEIIKKALNNIYNCSSYKFGKKSIYKYKNFDGVLIPIEIILLAIKWIFIEEDLNYWNWSGRAKFYFEELIKHKLI